MMCEKRFHLDMELVPNGKRFHLDMELVPPSIVDLSDGTHYPIEDEGIFEDVVKLLNEVETERITYMNKFENCKRNCVAVKKSGFNDEQQGIFRVRFEQEDGGGEIVNEKGVELTAREVVDLLNKQQITISQLQDLCGESDGENAKLRIENKELQEEIKLLKPTNIEQYEQIVQLQEENEPLRLELETHKHSLWSTREAERKVNKLADSLADEVKKNGLLNEEINQLRIENMRLKKKGD